MSVAISYHAIVVLLIRFAWTRERIHDSVWCPPANLFNYNMSEKTWKNNAAVDYLVAAAFAAFMVLPIVHSSNVHVHFIINLCGQVPIIDRMTTVAEPPMLKPGNHKIRMKKKQHRRRFLHSTVPNITLNGRKNSNNNYKMNSKRKHVSKKLKIWWMTWWGVYWLCNCVPMGRSLN